MYLFGDMVYTKQNHMWFTKAQKLKFSTLRLKVMGINDH